MSKTDCPFCLSNGEVVVIQETELAFLVAPLERGTGRPLPGRYLVVPKEHIESISGLPRDWQEHLSKLLDTIVEFKNGVPFNLSYNQGRGAGQRVSHVHGWLIFRQPDEQGTQAYELGLNSLIEKCREIKT